jgi:hypothetical protein
MDPFVQAAANVGSDFAAFMAFNEPVTVAQIDPDTGAATIVARGVPALKRVRRRAAGSAGGELPRDECRFTFAITASGPSGPSGMSGPCGPCGPSGPGGPGFAWLLKARDQITDADGYTWDVQSVETIAQGNLVRAITTIRR